MGTIKIKTNEFYDRPEYYAFMPASIFNALEEAELKGALTGEDIEAEVPEEDFQKMLREKHEHDKNINNGTEKS
jgi:hypothetical protein